MEPIFITDGNVCVSGEERQICKIICKSVEMIQLTELHTELQRHC